MAEIVGSPSFGGRICPRCGEAHKFTASFCRKCGTPLRGSTLTRDASGPSEPKDIPNWKTSGRRVLLFLISIGLGVIWLARLYTSEVLVRRLEAMANLLRRSGSGPNSDYDILGFIFVICVVGLSWRLRRSFEAKGGDLGSQVERHGYSAVLVLCIAAILVLALSSPTGSAQPDQDKVYSILDTRCGVGRSGFVLSCLMRAYSRLR